MSSSTWCSMCCVHTSRLNRMYRYVWIAFVRAETLQHSSDCCYACNLLIYRWNMCNTVTCCLWYSVLLHLYSNSSRHKQSRTFLVRARHGRPVQARQPHLSVRWLKPRNTWVPLCINYDDDDNDAAIHTCTKSVCIVSNCACMVATACLLRSWDRQQTKVWVRVFACVHACWRREINWPVCRSVPCYDSIISLPQLPQ